MEDKIKQWLSHQTKDISNIDFLIFPSCQGEVVYFYDVATLNDLDYFITVPMFKELKDGKNPKNIANKYLKQINGNKS